MHVISVIYRSAIPVILTFAMPVIIVILLYLQMSSEMHRIATD